MLHENNQNTYMADLFNALAHPSRLEILELLRDGEACVCHIQAMLEQRQAYISQHLNVLRQAGLVASRKEGLRVYYQISDPKLFEVIDQVGAILRSSGKWQPADSAAGGAAAAVHSAAIHTDLAEQKKACTCPQCSGQAAAQESRYMPVEPVQV
jgi:ArsR family transcriptional regulator